MPYHIETLWNVTIPVSYWNVTISYWNITISYWNIMISYWNVMILYWNVTISNRIIMISYSLLRRGHPDIPMTYIPITYIPMTKSSMCRYSYKKSVEISNHFNDNRLQQNNTPLLQHFNNSLLLLCVDISTAQSSYMSILKQT
jgi:hypothetical protein